MGYNFTVRKDVAVHVKVSKSYPWPCTRDPDRTIFIDVTDVLSKEENGTYFKHTGLGCMNIQIPDEDVVPFEDDVHLAIL